MVHVLRALSTFRSTPPAHNYSRIAWLSLCMNVVYDCLLTYDRLLMGCFKGGVHHIYGHSKFMSATPTHKKDTPQFPVI